jgi:hypothetical protein
MKNFLFLLLALSSLVKAQSLTAIDTTRIATYTIKEDGNKVTFTPVMPPQIPMAGAPKPFYNYFWEFGDGNFSKEENPTHIYASTGEFTPHLSVKSSYDNGSKPPIRPRPRPRPKSVNANDRYVAMAGLGINDTLMVFNDKDPIPNDEIVVVVRYKNPNLNMSKGKLLLYYNDKLFDKNNFELAETRNHFGENEIRDTEVAYNNQQDYGKGLWASNTQSTGHSTNYKSITDAKKWAEDNFRNKKQFQLQDLESQKTNNIFFSFKTTPEMLKDTSAIVRIHALYIPDENMQAFSTKTIEMEIVSAHDPNKMANNSTLINYRLVRFKRVKFKTRFQNEGKGPANTIRLETDVPDMFDKKTLIIEDMYPKCPICPKEEVRYSCLDTIIKAKQIHFTFKNVYLPGTNQKNVKEKDSTKGFVSYSLKFGDDFHKVKTKSKTAIFFDKEEPVITNYTTTRFKPGISIGARAGYNYILPKDNDGLPNPENRSFFIGATISPFKSYRWYWQSEIDFTYSESTSNNLGRFFTPNELNESVFRQTEFENKSTQMLINVVPVSLRYNVNNFIGLGTGPQLNLVLNNKLKQNSITRFYAVTNPTGELRPGEEIIDRRLEDSSEIATFEGIDRFQFQWFADATLGFARIGPSVGVRYLRNFNTQVNTLQFYAIWKF